MHDLMPYLKYLHALYSGSIALLVFYQGWIGLKIRRKRIAGQPPVVKAVKRHRTMGPIVALMGIAGFFAGAVSVYLNDGRIFEHPVHFIIGLSIAALIFITYLISKKIKAGEPTFRNLHLFIGVVIICFYFIQAFIGINMLFSVYH
jgi:hypothetical protein